MIFLKKVLSLIFIILIEVSKCYQNTTYNTENEMFMTSENIIECVNYLKFKNTEGYKRIPQRVLVDGLEWLIEQLTHLFKLIYNKKTVPEQWLVSKIIPFHKKGNKASCPVPYFNSNFLQSHINVYNDQ